MNRKINTLLTAEKKQEMKEKAIELLEELDIYKPYIRGFKNKGDVCYFENFGGFWAYQEPELTEKIKQVEKEYECLVYAVTHEYTGFGELYSMLIVPKYKQEWNDLVKKQEGNRFAVFAYVWNKDDDYCSEFGNIGVQSWGGGLRRFA